MRDPASNIAPGHLTLRRDQTGRIIERDDEAPNGIRGYFEAHVAQRREIEDWQFDEAALALDEDSWRAKRRRTANGIDSERISMLWLNFYCFI